MTHTVHQHHFAGTGHRVASLAMMMLIPLILAISHLATQKLPASSSHHRGNGAPTGQA